MHHISNKSVLVLGLARSGYAVAKLLLDLGAKVSVSDLTHDGYTAIQADELSKMGAFVVLGEHPLSLLENVDLIVKNPGIHYDIPILLAALQKAIPIVTEIEIASLVTKSPILAITGSNGKTTTTTWIGEMFKKDEKHSVVAGNIGTALSTVVNGLPEDTWIITEVSSFQLQGTIDFHPEIAVLLNVYPTHIDYHGSFEEYKKAKFRLIANLGTGDIAVLNMDKDNLSELAYMLEKAGTEVHGFSMHFPVKVGLYVKDHIIYYQSAHGHEPILMCMAEDIALPGEFNLENALAAGTAALAAGISVHSVRDVWRSFQGVEHRLELVGKVRDITYYNDSKATNPQAAIRAITSFSSPVVAIMGGLERGDDLSVLIPALKKHVKAVVVLGESAKRMQQLASDAGISSVKMAGSIEEAVFLATQFARSGDIVLLSPAAASWDMFPSFEVRGNIFKEVVHKL